MSPPKQKQKQSGAVTTSRKPKPTPLLLADHIAAQLYKRSNATAKKHHRNTRKLSFDMDKRKKTSKSGWLARERQSIKPRNPLDSSAPRIMYRGFQRRTPKVRKTITPMKRKLLAGRAELRMQLSERLARMKDKKDRKAIDDNHRNAMEQQTTKTPTSPMRNIWLERGPPNIVASTNNQHTTGTNTPLKRRKTRRATKKKKKKNSGNSSNQSLTLTSNEQLLNDMPIQIRYILSHTLNYNRGLPQSYCDQLVSIELDKAVTNLLGELIRFQKRKQQQDPIKAKIRKRYVIGLRETLRALALNKARCVIMAKNIEYIHPSEEQLDPLVVEIRQQCYHQAIPLVYSMTRRQLGQATGEARGRRAGGVACLALLMIDGAEPLYEQVLNQAEKDSTNWRNYFCSLSPSTESAMPWNNYRETPIWLAAWHGYSVDVVRICLEKGWPIDACPITIPATDNGNSNASENEYHHWTPLMAAAYRGHTHLVAYLLANGANVNAQDQQNRSALWLAVEQGHVQVVKELLKPIHGTDATIRDKHDQTVLHVAIQKNHVKIIEILRQLN